MTSEQCSRMIRDFSTSPPTVYSDLKVLILNCTLNRTPVLSHTEGVIRIAQDVFTSLKVSCELIRPVDYEIAAGLGTDMSQTPEWDRDEWPRIQTKIDQCDILLLCTSVWLGEKTSVCNRVLERMYGYTHLVNGKGQYRDYGKVGATLITGNEDGIKHCAMNILFSLSHIGYTIPPQADAGWVGEAGPGPSYRDPGSGGPGERLHQPEHGVPGLELSSSGAHAQGCRWLSGPWQCAGSVGRRLPPGTGESRASGLRGHSES